MHTILAEGFTRDDADVPVVRRVFMAVAEFLRSRGRWGRLSIAALAGGAAGCAQPPVDAWPALFLAFPALVWLVDGLPQRRILAAFTTGWAFGAGYFAVCLYWVGAAFLVDAATYLWMMPFAVAALAGAMALYWGLALAVASLAWMPGIGRIVVLAASLALAEWLRGHLLTGFPWTALGLASLGMGGVAQTASLWGMTGLSLLVPLWAALPALLGDRVVSGTHRLSACLIAVGLVLSWGWGEWRLTTANHAKVDGVSLRIVQPSIPQNDKWRAENRSSIFNKLLDLTRKPGADNAQASFTHVIWPESSLPFYVEESPDALASISGSLGEDKLLIMGALRRGDRQPDGSEPVYNSILGFDGFSNLVARYDKWRLVPGGEFLPFAKLLEPLGFRKIVTVPGSFAAGNGPVTLPVAGAPPAGFLICYEAIFPDRLLDTSNRPSWLINVTNDGWFGDTSGPYQHLAQVRMRAIEQGLPVMRAANSGISAVVDGYGQILQSLDLGRTGVIDSPLPVALNETAYGRTGDLWLILPMLILIGSLTLPRIGSRAT